MTYSTFWESLRDLKPSPPSFLPKDYPDLTGKNVFITGTSAGVGYQAAKLLLEKNATVVMFNRNKKKTDDAIAKIKEDLIKEDTSAKFTDELLTGRIVSINGDLSDLSTIKPAIDQFKTEYKDKITHFDIVIFNAGVMQPPNGSSTKQGYELQFGTNVIGHQLVANLINDLILNTTKVHPGSNPRVIWLSSLAHSFSPSATNVPHSAGLTWDFKDSSKSKEITIYGQSKAGNVYQAARYGQLHKKDGIISLAVHPGLLNSELARHYPSFMNYIASKISFHPIYGAYTELYAALSDDVKLDGSYSPGNYYGPWGEKRPLRPDIDAGRTDGTAEKLWNYVQDELKEYL
ncbi:hypothetical protein WICPIJ_006270 [Wickerhamomyces pijperi]|uniref:NAD(P)-binding protein n=1 Tax=Wickerhamomyces pijperi TaxID=599730 RepID=A0A9P8Q2G0_WICPI|nr:hypothetical protein WICPIJ_006270 [Wickerhamomyces pijperi]